MLQVLRLLSKEKRHGRARVTCLVRLGLGSMRTMECPHFDCLNEYPGMTRSSEQYQGRHPEKTFACDHKMHQENLKLA